MINPDCTVVDLRGTAMTEPTVEEIYWQGFNACAVVALTAARFFEEQGVPITARILEDHINSMAIEAQANLVIKQAERS